ncbi:hypothetical protein [Algisphaera agarilytica]|uniref:Uncharacterized protein n=1 Tax=Algisphaera agarilytica TaxID=1385975 RepID=A0A7X0LK29_9BACT|nr:hypothetical protein [Algisphaera agarilytica]MBB6429211.1 hypothetical protein [Algisphaera agarilytica]
MSERLTEYCRLARRRHELKAKLADVERLMQSSRPAVVDEVEHLRAMGRPRFSRHGMELRLTNETKVKAIGDTDDLVDALRKDKKKELIGVNWPALIAWAKRVRTVPDAIAKVLDVRVVPGVDAKRVKRGGK